MTKDEAMQMALETLDNMVKVDWHEWDEFASVEDFVRWAKSRASFTAEALRIALAQPEPVAMKFQIYRPTPPRGRELDPINSGLLPWVYDQDPSSGNIASMWVTPVAPLPPQRKPDVQIGITYEEANPPQPYCKRCGKKLGTEVTDIHTCTPPENFIDSVKYHAAIQWNEEIETADPKPIAYLCENAVGHKYFRWKKPSSEYKPIPLYTAPLKKEWVGLTDEEIKILEEDYHGYELVPAIEAKLKEKNT